MTNRKLFVNLPVRDLERSMAFFSKLRFEFNQQFTGDKAACMVINGEACVMLLTQPFFKTFTTRELCDTSTHLQALLSVSCESRAEVDELVKIAVDNGGTPAGEPQDHGFMYDWSFYDLDGHGWGVLWMDPSFAQK
jgi:predicted lactoylglutathione lyase